MGKLIGTVWIAAGLSIMIVLPSWSQGRPVPAAGQAQGTGSVPGPDATSQAVNQAYGLLGFSINEALGKAAEREVLLRNRLGDMDKELTYWRTWCGSKPGCQQDGGSSK